VDVDGGGVGSVGTLNETIHILVPFKELSM